MILNNESNKKKKFEQFFIMTYPKVKAFAWKLLKSEEDAEDIAQDIFAKLWTNPEIWENQETWNSYIYAMVRNHIYNFLKHKSIRQTYQEQCTKEEPAISETDIHDQLYAKESELLIKLTIANMPEQRRKIFRMSRTQEKSNQEIADELDTHCRAPHLFGTNRFKKSTPHPIFFLSRLSNQSHLIVLSI